MLLYMWYNLIHTLVAVLGHLNCIFLKRGQMKGNLPGNLETVKLHVCVYFL